MATRTVFSWVEDSIASEIKGGRLPSGRATAPAIRVWGDVILELASERRQLEPRPPLSIRREAIFAWTQRTPLPSTLREPSRVQLQIDVDPALCAAARRDLIDPLFSPQEWRALKLWLQEHGHPADLIEEEVMIFEAPNWPLHLGEGFNAVKSTQPALLDDIVRYFEPDTVKYIESWQPLNECGGEPPGSWEVVVPVSAVQHVILLT